MNFSSLVGNFLKLLTNILCYGFAVYAWYWSKDFSEINAHFGSEHLALMALKKGDFKQLTDVEGISEQKAADLIDAAKDANTFLATKEAVRLHKSIMQHIAACANNNVT